MYGSVAKEVLRPVAGGLDPDSDDQVDASLDDAYQGEYSGTVYVDFTYAHVSSGTSTSGRRWGGLRFHNGPFPAKGSTILAAYLTPYIFDAANDDANFNIYAEDGAAPGTFTTDAFDITDRTRTAASVPWIADAIAAGGVGWFNSPSIVDVIQELVTDYDCTAIVLILKPNSDATKNLYLQSWDEASHALGAKLHLEWTEAGPPAGHPTMRRWGGIPGMRLTGRSSW